MKTLFFYSFGLIFLLLGQSAIAATKTPTKPPVVTPTTKINSFDDYGKECLNRVKQQGFAEDIGKDICQCTMTQFRKKYTFKEFKNLVQKAEKEKKTNSKKDKNSPSRLLSNVGEACFDEVLYEK